MVCSKCGALLKEGCIYCSQCGQEAQIVSEIHVLEDDLLRNMMEEKEASYGQRREASDYSRELTEDERRRNRNREKEKRVKQKKNLVLLLIVLAVVAIGAVSIASFQRSRSVPYLLTKADEAYNQKDYVTAGKYLDKIFALDPENQQARLMDGEIALETKDYQIAETRFLEAISADPFCQQAYQGLIALYDEQDQYQRILSLMKDVTDEEILTLFEDFVVPAPELSQESGEYSEYFTVEIKSQKKKLDIYYTLDGTTPTESDLLYKEPVEISQQGKIILTAVCMDTDGNYSEPVSAEYMVELNAPDVPRVSPDGGQFSKASTVSITVPEGTTVYYTWDGSTPNSNSDKYRKPILIPEGNNILSVIAIDQYGMKSDVMKYNYIYYPESQEETSSDAGAITGENQ